MTSPTYDIGEYVYLITDEEQKKRIITAIHIYPGNVVYGVTCGTDETNHYDIELSPEKNMDYICGIE